MHDSPLSPPPLSLYLHLPWCIRKCPYCDFNSHALSESVDFAGYVDALIDDLNYEQGLAGARELVSIFIGGGTPSLFPAEEISRLLENVTSTFRCAGDLEVTLEANPGAAERARFAGYRAAGVNRLSIGVQSFDDRKLASLGRVHNSVESDRAVEAAYTAGFDNINLDLMSGLPYQSPQEGLRDVERALAYAPSHLSYYQLTLEPNTRFAAFPPRLPDEHTLGEIQRLGLERLEDAGYRQYEVSAFSRPGLHCRHNLNYWQFGDYLGIGAGAHGKLSRVEERLVERRARVRGPEQYLLSAGGEAVVSERRALSAGDLQLEFVMNALRLKDGFEPALFTSRTGLAIAQVDASLAQARRRGLLSDAGGRIRATEQGWSFLNDLLTIFV
ncbi:MAG: radical SAM family heme chaperone HemW [Gammaproteobacteria bacterium]|nr:radical SAM family heme chaperone HemW [Gammaproteobacteria bacterium]